MHPAQIAFIAFVGTTLAVLVWIACGMRTRFLAEKEVAHLGTRLLAGQEAERSRIARDLHDGITQQLALVALELDNLERRLAEEGNPRLDVAVLAQRVRTIAADLQHVAYGLHPARLEHLGLVPAVRALAREMQHEGFRIEVSQSEWPADLSDEVALALYRVAQEALHNAAKYSRDDTVWVSFHGGHHGLSLTVTDHGVGFAPKRAGSFGGLGIVSMRQRLRTIGGSLDITAAPGHGTSVHAHLPHHVQLSSAAPMLILKRRNGTQSRQPETQSL
jgi:signal transduction histidine kinase